MKSLIYFVSLIFVTQPLFADEHSCLHIFKSQKDAPIEIPNEEDQLESDFRYGSGDEVAPYKRYLTKLPKKYLSASEERTIYESINNKSPGWEKEAEKLILSNLWFAFQQSSKYFHLTNVFIGISKMDLIQAANIGLINAVKFFNPDRGRYKTIAGWHIINEIRTVLHEQSRLIQLPIEFEKDIRVFKFKKEQMTKANGGIPVSDFKVFNELGWSAEKRSNVLLFSHEPTSLNTPLPNSRNEGTTIQDTLKDEETHTQEIVESDYKESINVALNTLTPRERQIMVLRFGLEGNEEHTLDEIGQKFNVSRERIRQISAQALFKMRKYLKATNLQYKPD